MMDQDNKSQQMEVNEVPKMVRRWTKNEINRLISKVNSFYPGTYFCAMHTKKNKN